MDFSVQKLPFRISDRAAAWKAARDTHSVAGHQHVGMRLESDRLILAIAQANPNGGHDVVLETIPCEDEAGWIAAEDVTLLGRTLVGLKQRFHLGQCPIAVSLSGDFCVTRISSGPVDHIDQEWEALADRVPRYLQLGPGGKVVGQSRETVAPGMEHALTAVGNIHLLQSLVQCFDKSGINVAWVEPSLVSLSRLVGLSGCDADEPVLIADSYGRSWEVGISYQGRLLLDYRPAAARDGKAFAEAIQKHMSRLRRFCGRHRGMDAASLNQVLVGGDALKVDVVLDEIGSHFKANDVSAQLLSLGKHDLNITADLVSQSDIFPAVAAVLPLIQNRSKDLIPDLLQKVRRDRQATGIRRQAVRWWPAAAACVLLAVTYNAVLNQRQLAAESIEKRTVIETQMRLAKIRMSRVQSQRQFIAHLEAINEKTFTPSLSDWIRRIASCLPSTTYLRGFEIDDEHQILLSGYSTEESDIYEIIGYMRTLPDIDQIALLGTTPDLVSGGSEFEIRLGWAGVTDHNFMAPDDEAALDEESVSTASATLRSVGGRITGDSIRDNQTEHALGVQGV